MYLCLLFSPIIVWTEKLKTAAELSSVWLHEVCLLGKSLFIFMSFCYQLLLKRVLASTTFHLFLFSDFLFTGCEWKQVATTGSSFAVTLAWLFPAPARAPLPMTVLIAGDVQTHSGYIYKGPGKI